MSAEIHQILTKFPDPLLEPIQDFNEQKWTMTCQNTGSNPVRVAILEDAATCLTLFLKYRLKKEAFKRPIGIHV